MIMIGTCLHIILLCNMMCLVSIFCLAESGSIIESSQESVDSK